MRRLLALVIIAATASLTVARPVAVASESRATQRVTQSEYRRAHDAWQIEGLDRHGVKVYFGFDGTQTSKTKTRAVRTYLGYDDEHFAVVTYRVRGRASIWRVIGMKVTANKACVTDSEYNKLYGEAVGQDEVATEWETRGKITYNSEGDGETTYPAREVANTRCLGKGHYKVAYTHNSDSTEWFTPALGKFTRADAEG